MWWAIGIGVVVVVAFLFMKFRAASHQVQLVTAGGNRLNISYRMMTIFDREIPRVWTDRYLLGHGQSSLAIMIQSYGKKRDTALHISNREREDRNHSSQALSDLCP